MKILISLLAKIRERKGFTFVELMIVIAIIAILAVVVVPAAMNYPSKARDMKRQQDIKKIADFLTAYYVTDGNWLLLSGQDGDEWIWYCIDGVDSGENIDFYDALIQQNLADFSGVHPKDPNAFNSSGQCSGNYFLVNAIKKPKSVENIFMIGTYVENEENGNVSTTTNAWKKMYYNDALDDSGPIFIGVINRL